LCGVTIICDVVSRRYVVKPKCVNAMCCCLCIVKWLLMLVIQHRQRHLLYVVTSAHVSFACRVIFCTLPGTILVHVCQLHCII